MKSIRLLLFLSASLIAGSISAQTITIKSGTLDSLKGQKILNISYDFSEFGVGKFDKEADYVAKKVSEYNEKEPGKGDKWKENWIGDRKSTYQPKFEELINKATKDAGLYVGPENKDAKYTLILKTTFIEPGFNVYVTKKFASVNVEAIFVETANPDKIIATILSKNNPGRTYGSNDMDTGIRIGEAYAKCGKELGAFLMKNGLK
jgi:hypothetical protein